jgi:hypothetical protein
VADNITLNAGSGGSTLAADDVSSVWYQMIKLAFGALDTATLVSSSAGLPVAQQGTWNVTNVSGTVSLPTGASTAAKQPALGTAGAASADVLTVQGVASMTPLKVDGSGVTQPVSGTVTATGPLTDTQLRATAVPVSLASAPSTAVTNAGTFAVQVTSAPSTAVTNAGTFAVQAAATQSGTWTVQPGNTANTTAWLVAEQAATAGGVSVSHAASAASTNATNVKASAGQLYGFSVQNTNAAARYIAFHNTAGTPTAGSSVHSKYLIPGATAGAGSNVFIPCGLAMGTGIAYTTVTGAADSDSTGVGANDLIINIFYK